MIPRTLVVGIQDLDAIPYGATLRVKQLVNQYKATYINVGNRRSWSSRGPISKVLQLIRFARPWREPFSSYHYSPRKWNDLETLLRTERFDRIILTEIWTYRYLSVVLEHCGNAKVVFDIHNVESILAASMYGKWRRMLMERTERNFIRKVDVVTCCSQVDAAMFLRIYGINALVVPNKVLVPLEPLELCERQSIGFVGTFNYKPNGDAAMELLRDIQPRLGCELWLIGKNPTEQMKHWYNHNIKITGEVKSVQETLRNVRTVVIPLRSGSGTRLKVLEAFANGIPVVATAKAVEGLDVIPGLHYFEAEDAQTIALAVKGLWANPAVEESMRTQARRFVQERYSWKN